MLQYESFTHDPESILSRLNDMGYEYGKDGNKALSEPGGTDEKSYAKAATGLTALKALSMENLPPEYFIMKADECHNDRKLFDGVQEKVNDLRREATGYDEREIMQMMYPDEDIDSEDFEDGFDIEDFYED